MATKHETSIAAATLPPTDSTALPSSPFSTSNKPTVQDATDADRENLLFMAKLAEQTSRIEGTFADPYLSM